MSVANHLGGFEHKRRREHPRKFIKLLDHDDAYVRQIALDLLFEQSQDKEFDRYIKEHMHKVINHISDSEEVVCRVAADALAKFKQRFYEDSSMESVFRNLIAQFNGNKDKLIRERAANSLIKLSKRDDFKTDIGKCIPFIKEFLKDNNAATREVAAYSLIKVSETGQYGAEIGKIINYLAGLIGTSEGSIPEFAAETLIGLCTLGPNEEISNASPIGAIITIIEDKTKDDDIRLVATRSLAKLVLIGKYKDIETAIPTCKELIIGENEKIRRAAALFLARLDRPVDQEQPESTTTPELKYSPIIPHRVREYRRHKATTECRAAKRTMPSEPWRRGEFDARSPSDISPWKRCIHPDGSPYYIYFYDSQGDQKDNFQAITECESGLKELAKVAKSLYDRYQDEWRDRKAPDRSYNNFGMYLTPLEPGVVPRHQQESNVEIGYYFVDFDWNQIFWCKADAGQVTLQKRTPTNSWEQKLSLRFLQHLGLFPNSNPPKWDIANFLRSSLVMSATLTGIDDSVASNPSLRVDSGTCSTILDLLSKLMEAEGHQCHDNQTFPEN